MVYKIASPEETERVGRSLAEQLKKSGTCRAFIAMRGEMGVGKTVFCRGFAGVFGIRGVKSPTYTIVNEYVGEDGTHVYHFDLYRITDADDLCSIGYDDYVRSDGYCIAEWSERVPEDIPDDAIYVTISRTGDSDEERTIEITGLPVRGFYDNSSI